MNIEYHKWWSQALSQDMELKIYGYAGKPVIVFPTQGGRFYQFEDYGMVGACSAHLAEGKIQLFTLDSVDEQSWANWNAHPAERALRHNQYDSYLTQEVVPFIQDHCKTQDKFLSTGCSMGGYHAANAFFRQPETFDTVISLSGIFRLNMFIGDYMDDNVYFNSPLAYLNNLEDPGYIDQYKNSKIIICAGQGAWEEEMISDAVELEKILRQKNIPCRIDLWGYDVNHDWPWWRIQLPYFLDQLDLPVKNAR